MLLDDLLRKRKLITCIQHQDANYVKYMYSLAVLVNLEICKNP